MAQHKTHTFDTDPNTFWQLYMLDRDFLTKVYAHMKLQIEDLDVLEHTGEGDTLVYERRIHILPNRELPGFLKKLVKGTALVKQRERLDMAKGEMVISIDVPVIGDRVDYGGTYTWRVEGDHFVRNWVGHCKVRIPLLGRKIESFFLDEIGQGIEDMAPFIRTWLAEKANEA